MSTICKDKIVFIRTNNFAVEPRLNKEYSTAKSFLDTSVISWDRERSGQSGQNLYSFDLYAKIGGKQYFLLFPLWMFFCFIKLIKISPRIIHACDSEGVLSGLLYAKLFRRKIIFDLWDATACRVPSGLGLKKFASWLDRCLASSVDAVLIPDEGRLKQIRLTKKVNYTLIPNSDVINKREPVRYNIVGKEQIVVTYIGILVGKYRGLEQIIEIAKVLPQYKIQIAGYGPDAAMIEKMILENNQLGNIHYLGKVSYADSIKINQKSDILLSLLDPDFTNYQYATSTKIFDAFSAYKPVITTANTASAKLVRETDWGITVDYQKDALKQALESISEGKKVFELHYDKVSQYDWRSVEQRLADVYRSLIT